MKREFFTDEKEQEKMLENNPYRQSSWFFPTPHESWNNRYIQGWIHGRTYAAQKILDYIKEKGLNKEDFRELLLGCIMTSVIDEK